MWPSSWKSVPATTLARLLMSWFGSGLPEAEGDGGVGAAEIGVAGDAGHRAGGDADDGFRQGGVWIAPVVATPGVANDHGAAVGARRRVVDAVEGGRSQNAGDGDAAGAGVDAGAAVGGDDGGAARRRLH